MSKYTYGIECPCLGKWNLFIALETRDFCAGYLKARAESSPRLHLRMVRSDGKVMDEVQPNESVGVGQVAGWPTAEQYERAGQAALERARIIRELNKEGK